MTSGPFYSAKNPKMKGNNKQGKNKSYKYYLGKPGAEVHEMSSNRIAKTNS